MPSWTHQKKLLAHFAAYALPTTSKLNAQGFCFKSKRFLFETKVFCFGAKTSRFTSKTEILFSQFRYSYLQTFWLHCLQWLKTHFLSKQQNIPLLFCGWKGFEGKHCYIGKDATSMQQTSVQQIQLISNLWFFEVFRTLTASRERNV